MPKNTKFIQNPTRIDPYKNFKFRVYFSGSTDPVAGISKVSSLKRTTDVVTHRDGGDPSTDHKSPGRSKFEAVTLERGITHDLAFEQWASKVWNPNRGDAKEVSLADFRKDISIALMNESGKEVIRYNLSRCWVSEYQPLSDLDANGNGVAIEHIKIETEGWVRDETVKEPKEEAFE